jgi:hypothetical protein
VVSTTPFRAVRENAGDPASVGQQPRHRRFQPDLDTATFDVLAEQVPQRRSAVGHAVLEDPITLADRGGMPLTLEGRSGVPARERRVTHGQRLGQPTVVGEPLRQFQHAVDVGGDHVARGAALGDREIVLDGTVTVQHRGEGTAGLRGAPPASLGLLQDQHSCAGVVRGHRRGRAGAAVTGDDDVVFGLAAAAGRHGVTMTTSVSPTWKAVAKPASFVMRCW